MKKSISLTVAVLLAVMLFVLCGCDVELPEVSEAKPTRTALVLVDVDVNSLLTKADMEEALGVTLREPQISNEGRTLFAIAEEGGISLSVSIEKQSIEKFRQALPQVADEDLQAAPNLADEAWWLSSGRTLFLYSRGYTASVTISDREADEESVLLACRQLATKLCNRLPME